MLAGLTLDITSHFGNGLHVVTRGTRGMSLQADIESLTDHQIGQVFEGLVDEMRKEIERLYVTDEAVLRQLSERGQASGLLSKAFSFDVSESLSLDSTSLRKRLLRIAEVPELQRSLKKALERRFFAASVPVDPILVYSLVLFVLALKFRLKVKGKNLEFEVSKEAGPWDLVRSLLFGKRGSDEK